MSCQGCQGDVAHRPVLAAKLGDATATTATAFHHHDSSLVAPLPQATEHHARSPSDLDGAAISMNVKAPCSLLPAPQSSDHAISAMLISVKRPRGQL